jgi:hemoglobin
MVSRSLYERLGGEAALGAVLDLFYEKLLSDTRVNYCFLDVDIDSQKEKGKSFLTRAFNGPNNYTGKDLRAGHSHLVERGLNEGHFDAFAELLSDMLKELNLPADLALEVMAATHGTRAEVVGR